MFRGFKYNRMAAINYVLENLKKAPFAFRMLPPTLMLGASVIYMMNALIYRPSGQQRELILSAASSQHVIDEDDAEVPIDDARGLFFLADIVLNDNSYRLPTQLRMTADVLAQMYGCKVLAEVELFFVPAMQVRQQPKANVTRVQNRFAMSTLTSSLREIEEVPAVEFNLAQSGIVAQPAVVMQGRDIQDDEAAPQETLDERVSAMWGQFAMDIVRKAPNKKNVQDPSYLVLAHEERRLATVELFQTDRLPLTNACYRVADDSMWAKAFDNYFPADATPRSVNTQNFGSVAYMAQWSLIRAQLDRDNLRLVRAALKRKFDKFVWIPYSSDRIWSTTAQKGKVWMHLPVGAPVPAPNLYINPRFGTRTIKLREALPEEGESNSE